MSFWWLVGLCVALSTRLGVGTGAPVCVGGGTAIGVAVLAHLGVRIGALGRFAIGAAIGVSTGLGLGVRAETIPHCIAPKYRVEWHPLEDIPVLAFSHHLDVSHEGGRAELDGLMSKLQHKQIVFMGDSITRYQYLDLAYAIDRQVWPRPWFPICNEHDKLWQHGWVQFYNLTNNELQGREVCDCLRTESNYAEFENRRYHNPELNFTLYMINWLGDVHNISGRVPIMDLRFNSTIDCTPTFCPFPAWSLNPAEFIKIFIMNYEPDFIVLNSGIWTRYSGEESTAQSIFRLAQELHDNNAKTKLIWKTTTPAFGEQPLVDAIGVNLSLANLGCVFDAGMMVSALYDSYIARRQDAMSRLYFDRYHFHCWVYEQLNRALLRSLLMHHHDRP